MRPDNGLSSLQDPDQEGSCTPKLDALRDGRKQIRSNHVFPTNNSSSNQPGINRFSMFISLSGTTIYTSRLADLTLLAPSSDGSFGAGMAGEIWWLDVLNSTKEDIKTLAKAFSLHPRTCAFINAEDAHERVEFFENYYFICFPILTENENGTLKSKFQKVNFHIVVFPQGIISFSFQHNSHSANVRNRIWAIRNDTVLSSYWICYALINDIVSSFDSAVHKLEQETCVIEESAFISRLDEVGATVSKIHNYRKHASNMAHLVQDKVSVVRSLVRHCAKAHQGAPLYDISLSLSAVQDHINSMISKLKHCEEILSRSHSDLISQLSVDKVYLRNQTLRIIIRITVIAAIAVLLHAICSLFGTNFEVPGEHTDGLDWWFGILGLIVFLFFLGLGVARQYKLI
ncbi:hypothetical protein BU24DRAFT_458332 [Aaosphaeria arxii CBS 175.79]|uniref:Mg2+ transporter protein n=1 Tax=Aaosphaeria arxii CBS 175.79 TaxID=1450172 RepID=A0A6A5Y1Z2_9PLEO|nr:uncharacterized protein BU24DRAFT_458332 [Aaosphaeria arxii CBS 175.79]KAF2018574.1 hypothetical protein BU24DRAFT_458332 [Aaosphaeria arxii CBS 175.79]